jgi:hypothetical protein
MNQDTEPLRIQGYTGAARETTRAGEELAAVTGLLTGSLTGVTDPLALEQWLALIDQRLVAIERSTDRVLGYAGEPITERIGDSRLEQQ